MPTGQVQGWRQHGKACLSPDIDVELGAGVVDSLHELYTSEERMREASELIRRRREQRAKK
jgi:hypothetical protein